ncbi:hypothetical protein BAME_39470 [Bacillus sp. M 2-6]|nr:hypothetical protein BAME_39470 [Bacillus sp. M 2-6]
MTNADDLDKIDRRKIDVIQVYSIKACSIPVTFQNDTSSFFGT